MTFKFKKLFAVMAFLLASSATFAATDCCDDDCCEEVAMPCCE